MMPSGVTLSCSSCYKFVITSQTASLITHLYIILQDSVMNKKMPPSCHIIHNLPYEGKMSPWNVKCAAL